MQPGIYQESTRNLPGIYQESWCATRTTRIPPGIRGAVESSGELVLRSLYKELQLECQNASFRIQYYYNQQLVLQEQIAKVLDKLHAHYPL
jgi:hypothetical protein